MAASPRCTDTRVYIEGLRVEAYIGASRKERAQTQPIVVDLCVELMPTIEQDALSLTFDYAPLIERIRTIALENDRKLIETLAQEIATVCLANPLVRTAAVSVKKPKKLPGCAAVGTQRTFTR